MSGGLTRLFAPRSVAVIGASDRPDKAGAAMLAALAQTPHLYPVNPRLPSIAGRTCYPRIGAAPAPVDLAVLVIPPAGVAGALADCVAAGVGAAVVCSGGFAESGPAGVALQDDVLSAVRGSSLRLLGPNTSGFIDPGAGVRANFMPAVVSLRPGPVGVLAQSGGMNLAISFLLHAEGIGVSTAVGLGNAVDVGFADVLDHLARDDRTRVIVVHIEGIADGRSFTEAIARATALKPIVAIKIGRSDVTDFAKSHTGALTGDWALTRAALTQAGAVVVDSLTELVDAAAALAYLRLPAAARPGVGIVTGQAGPGLLIADQLRSRGIATPELAEPTIKELATLLPPLTFQRNPVDTGRPEETFTAVVEQVSADEGIDLTVVYALQEGATEAVVDGLVTPSGLIDGAGRAPTVFVSGGPANDLVESRSRLRAAGVPVFSSPDRGATGAWALAVDADLRFRATSAAGPGADPPARDPSRIPKVAAGERLDEDAAKTLLGRLGLASPARRVVTSRADALEAFAAIGPPVVVKLCDARVIHKSDLGAVCVGVESPDAVERALDRIDAAVGGRAERYLIEAQAPPGVELIVGAVRDPVFGPTVALGLGGVDVAFGPPAALALAPIRPADAAAMVAQLPEPVRCGHRGQTVLPVDEMLALLVRVGDLMMANPAICEVDVNPVRITGTGLLALDAVIVTYGSGC